MDDFLKAIKIEEVYRFDLMSESDILKYLGKWDNLTNEQQSEYLRESTDLPENLVYGEITKKGVKELSNYLNNYKGVFYDIGCGNGRLLLHLSLISNFDKYVGVEISKTRIDYAIEINKTLNQERVIFICDDILNVDISDANFIFMDDIMFSDDLRNLILEKIPKDCYYISCYVTNDEVIETIFLDVSWFDFKKMSFFIYKKR
jgi:SAM-dependent methyltransferase